MKNLFDPTAVDEIRTRLATLEPRNERQWGKMTAAQAMAHCAAAFDVASGNMLPPRAFPGRIIGPMIKRLVLRNDDPIRRNSPTMKELIIEDERDLGQERERLRVLIDRFAAAGPKGCTAHPHSFFGRLTPEEWAVLMYKHLDHHLRQFGA
jgi:Protein of unknown function (DUF1569)